MGKYEVEIKKDGNWFHDIVIQAIRENKELKEENENLKKEAVHFMKTTMVLTDTVEKVVKLYEEGKSFREAIEIVKSTLKYDK